MPDSMIVETALAWGVEPGEVRSLVFWLEANISDKTQKCFMFVSMLREKRLKALYGPQSPKTQNGSSSYQKPSQYGYKRFK